MHIIWGLTSKHYMINILLTIFLVFSHATDSPKRQRLWETGSGLKPDTPAIVGVKSRLHGLAGKRSILLSN